MSDDDVSAPRVMIVGSGWHFTSGISYYTCSLANAFAATTSTGATSALLMRRLVPTFLYPGRRRAGKPVNDLDFATEVDVYDGVDWSWGASMRRGSEFLAARNPDLVILQWWTGAVLHTYTRLAREARRRGATVVMEWHEVQDTGEARVPGVARYVRRAMGRLLRYVDAHVVHSSYDLDLLEAAYAISATGVPVKVVPHGPYDHVHDSDSSATTAPVRSPDPRFNLLFFGVIRPYKGLEDLVAGFDALPAQQRDRLHLTIVGETWEGWDCPLDDARSSPAANQITVVNRYVSDAEARQHFANADAVVLPYRRSSSSGPLHLAMSAGLPVLLTNVGGLSEAASDYAGARFVPPGDVAALTTALAQLTELRGQRFANPRSWSSTITAYEQLHADVRGPRPAHDPVVMPTAS